jgi:hypothetical protein
MPCRYYHYALFTICGQTSPADQLINTFRDTHIPKKWRAAFAESEIISWGNAIGEGSFGVVKEAVSRTHGAVAIKTQTFRLKDNAGLLDKLRRCLISVIVLVGWL